MYNISDINYAAQLHEKAEATIAEFNELGVDKLEIHESIPHGFRMRAEFKIWHESGVANYAMFTPGDNKKPYFVTEFPIAHPSIQGIMPSLINKINSTDQLKNKLFQVEFLTTTTNDTLVTLIYHRQLGDEWLQLANQLADELRVSIIGRSKKQKLVIGRDYVIEKFVVAQKTYSYQQTENAFTQPNASVCEKMLNWAVSNSSQLGGDMLELYCGNGNFTIPLAKNFNRVLATEISKPSIRSALINCELNNINNVTFIRMSSEEFTEALNNTRPFRRLKNVDLPSYQFSTIFLDPPRAGLDEGTQKLAKKFKNIIYVSCNPSTLQRDIEKISDTHKIVSMALFDQFPYTHHRECGVILTKKEN